MSSSDEGYDYEDGRGRGPSKRRKVLRACDMCRRRKIRCDAYSMPGNRCSHCTEGGHVCSFLGAGKKRGPPKGYTEDLEKRCEGLEKIIKRIAPDLDIEAELGPGFTKETWAAINSAAREPSPPAPPELVVPPGPVPPSPEIGPIYYPLEHLGLPRESPPGEPIDIASAPIPSSGPDDFLKDIETRMEELNINGFKKRFHGKSSGVSLVHAAMSLKEQVSGPSTNEKPLRLNLRERYWKPNLWEWKSTSIPDPAKLQFPDEDLADKLVDKAFRHALLMYPAIHRPTFEKQRREKAYLRSISFARVYLMACAVGARYCQDERVFLRNDADEIEWASGGWLYFSQVVHMKRPMLAPASLSDLQVIVLMCLYLQSTSAPHAAWLLAGTALRAAQDLGAHRERLYGAGSTVEDQMWKRIFWSLISIDRFASTGLGRPLAIFDEDIDATLPIEVDDEFYGPDATQWIQAPGKPALMTGFNHLVKLYGIMAHALRTLYSLNKTKAHRGFVGEAWETEAVSQLDSSLNSWLDTVPAHLKWNPNIEDDVFFEQAVQLKLTYHFAQITVHRPFIPALFSEAKSSPLSFPSLAICTSAARGAARILEAYSQKGFVGSAIMYVMAFSAGTILLVGIWGSQKSGLRVDLSKQVEDVQRCIRFLHKAEKTWLTAGRFYDMLTELASSHNVPLPQVSPSPPDTSSALKRSREEDTSSSIDSVASTAASPFAPNTSSTSGSHPPEPPHSQYYGLFNPLPASHQPPVFTSPVLHNNVVPEVTTFSETVSGAMPVPVPRSMVAGESHAYHVDGMQAPATGSSNIFGNIPLSPGVPESTYMQAMMDSAGGGGLLPGRSTPVPSSYWSLHNPEDWGWFQNMLAGGLPPGPPL